MEQVKYPVIAATLFVLVFNLMPLLGVGYTVIAVLFMVSPLVTLWMVYKVLRDAEPTEQTFDEYWYEDYARGD